jgi:hypothetical protein
MHQMLVAVADEAVTTRAATGVGVSVVLFVYLAIVIVSIVAAVKVVTKAGYSGWWVLITLVPLVNFVMLLVFAFSEWPVIREVKTLRAQVSSGSGYGTPGYGTPGYGTPGYGTPGYGAPEYGTPGYGTPGYGAPEYGTPGYGPAAGVGGHPQTPGPTIPNDPGAERASGVPSSGVPPTGDLEAEAPPSPFGTVAPSPTHDQERAPTTEESDDAPPGDGPEQGAQVRPGWYPTPDGRTRYWDGTAWTDHFA